jgi:hypothetical protein
VEGSPSGGKCKVNTLEKRKVMRESGPGYAGDNGLQWRSTPWKRRESAFALVIETLRRAEAGDGDRSTAGKLPGGPQESHERYRAEYLERMSEE